MQPAPSTRGHWRLDRSLAHCRDVVRAGMSRAATALLPPPFFKSLSAVCVRPSCLPSCSLAFAYTRPSPSNSDASFVRPSVRLSVSSSSSCSRRDRALLLLILSTLSSVLRLFSIAAASAASPNSTYYIRTLEAAIPSRPPLRTFMQEPRLRQFSSTHHIHVVDRPPAEEARGAKK